MADYQGPYSGAQVDAALKAATELQPIVTEIEGKLTELSDAVTLQGTKTSLNEAEIRQLKDSKADKEGYYSSLVAGAAENLINTSGDGVVRELTYDTAGGTADIGTGTAIIKRMRGKSLVWNQCYGKGADEAGTWEGNILTINGVYSSDTTSYDVRTYNAEYVDAIANHKYYVSVEIISGTIVGNLVYVIAPAQPYTSFTLNESTKAYQSIISSANAGYLYWFIRTKSSGSEFTNVKVRHVVHDLTQMFGAGNEPATIEEFKSLFPRDDYEYNAGEVIHFNGRMLMTTGFNQFNGTHAKVIGGNAYYFTGTFTSLGFTEEIGGELTPITLGSDKLYTPPTNGYIYAEGENICINLSWSGYRNGEYEPYEEHILELPYGVYGDGLKSAGTAYDEVTEERYVKRIGAVDLGTLNWVGSTAEGYENSFWAKGQLADKAAGSNLTTIYSITNANGWIIASNADKAICGSTNAGYEKDIWVRDSAYTDAATFKAAMSGVMLYYELAEPEVTEFETPLNLGYYVNDFGTEMILPENGIVPLTAPAVFDILYAMNAVDTLRNLPTNYISKESFDNFSAALSSALANAGITMSIKATFDEESGTYNYTITASKTE